MFFYLWLQSINEYIAAEKGIKVNYVPAKGGADMIQLILGKQVDMSFSGGIHTRHPDKIKMIASVADYRHASAPNVKTLQEVVLILPREHIILLVTKRYVFKSDCKARSCYESRFKTLIYERHFKKLNFQ